MKRLRNGVQNYYWGSPTWIPELLGEAATGQPVAEQWIGIHPLVPSLVEEPDGTTHPLSDEAADLPFMVKLLAANQPLSLQVHPSRSQAREGYAAEQAAGVPLDAPHRVYKDENHKPEMVYALTTFDSLVGFRPVVEMRRVLEPLGTPLTDGVVAALEADPGAVVSEVERLLTSDVTAADVDAVVAACRRRLETGDDVRRAYATAVEVAEWFPGDVGVVVSLLLNRMTLQPGESAYLGAGIVHAHLHGLCVEVMATSDNVLRAGLTTKHVDPAGLVTALQAASPEPVSRLTPQPLGGGSVLLAPGPDIEFAVVATQVAGETALHPARPAVVLCTAGEVVLRGATELVLRRGQSAWVAAGDPAVTVAGLGEVVMAFDPTWVARTTTG